MFILFKVRRPFQVPFCRTRNGGKLITRGTRSEFWGESSFRYNRASMNSRCLLAFCIRSKSAMWSCAARPS